MIIINDELKKVLLETAELLKEEYKQRLTDGKINASFELYNSINFEVTNNESSYLITFKAQDYWKDIEYGKKPGSKPNYKDILNWIKVKPVLPQQRNGNLPTQEQLASLITRSINKKGTKGKHILENTLDEIFTKQTEKIQKALGKDYEISIEIMLSEELSNNNVKITNK